MNPKISIVIPVYNTERYIAECLDSVCRQTLYDIEIILVDDVGIDGSMSIAEKYAAKDKRIKIVRHEKNSGPSFARNTGIRNSAAPLLMFLDSDDVYAPNMCEKMLTCIEQSNADMAISGINVVYETNKEMQESDARYYKIEFNGLKPVSDRLLQKIDVSPCNKIHRREILEKYDIWFPDGLKYEDAFFFNAYTCWTKNIYFIPEQLYHYRRREGSTMNLTFDGKSECSMDHLKIAIAFYEYLKRYDLFAMRKNYMAEFFFAYLDLTIRYAQEKQYIAKIYDFANSFIRQEHWFSADFPPFVQRKIELLKNRTLHDGERAILWGIIQIKEFPEKQKIYFLRIPVWKTKWTHDGIVRYYLFAFIRIVKYRMKDELLEHEITGIQNEWRMAFKKALKYIFSLENEAVNKVLVIFGVKIRFKNKHKQLENKVDTLLLRMEECSLRLEQTDRQINIMRDVLTGRTPRAYIQYFETHLTDHCNLNCKGCAHYCPLVETPVFHDIDEFNADFEELSAKLTVEQIRLMGDEPLLHPDVNKFMAVTRRFFPRTRISLVTNGILLPKMNGDFWRVLRDNDIFLDISKYPPLKDKHEAYGKLARENAVRVRDVGFADKFWCAMNSKGDSDMQESYRKCSDMLNCYTLRHGRMMMCPEACFMDVYNEYFDESIPSDEGIDIYKNSGEEIVKYLQTPHETCRYCTPRGRTFEWGVSAKEKSEWDVNVEV